MGCVYMKVTKDKYELPLAIADTAKELAEICNTKPDTIHCIISRRKKGKLKHGSYVKVDL